MAKKFSLPKLEVPEEVLREFGDKEDKVMGNQEQDVITLENVQESDPIQIAEKLLGNKQQDLTSSEAERQGYQKILEEMRQSRIREIDMDLIDDFPNHPFKVKDDEDMMRLTESIQKNGVITPATVLKKEDGRYIMISGHRRKRASKLCGFNTLRCEIVDMTIEEATIQMVESNFQRSKILPSELAFAYKMRLDAMKQQGKRTDLTCATPLHKSMEKSEEATCATLLHKLETENDIPREYEVKGKKSRDILAEQAGKSHEQIRKYIRLTNLVPELLDMVDEEKIKMRPAVEISYLDEDAQRDLVDAIDITGATPSHAQAKEMRNLFAAGELDEKRINHIMRQQKGNQKEKYSVRADLVNPYVPKNVKSNKMPEFIIDAVRFYSDYLMQQQKEKVSKDRNER